VNMSLSSILSDKTMNALTSFADRVMDPTTAESTHQLLKNVEGTMDFETSKKLIQQQSDLPDDVTVMVQGGASMDEKSLAKARRALNKLYEEAWVKLDKALGNCKSFQERFEQNDGQVTRDVNRLVERINDLSRVESESTLGIEQLRKDVKGLKATKRSETQAYLREKASDASYLTTFKNDLQVFAFIVTYTGEKCQKPDVASFAQVCTTKKGKKMLVFEDKHVQEGYQKLLTNTSKKSIEDILESLGADGNSFLQSSPPTTTILLAYTVTPPPADQVMEVGPPKVSTYPTGQSDCGEDCATLGDCTPPPPCPIHESFRCFGENTKMMLMSSQWK